MIPVLNTKEGKQVIRTSKILTTSYVAENDIEHDGFDAIIIWYEFTKGSSDGVDLKIELSHDKVTWYQEPQWSQEGQVTTHAPNEHHVTDAGNAYILARDMVAKYIRISAKATTNGTGTLLKLTVQSISAKGAIN